MSFRSVYKIEYMTNLIDCEKAFTGVSFEDIFHPIPFLKLFSTVSSLQCENFCFHKDEAYIQLCLLTHFPSSPYWKCWLRAFYNMLHFYKCYQMYKTLV